MASRMLRLRVPPPYEGESMSSFIGRASQFYAMPPAALLKELMDGVSWPAGWRRDLDLGIPAKLEERLAESVTDWRSPLVKHGGFCHWILAGASRTAYCPQCFKEDLEQGRIPFFRNDWIAVCVTSCWAHRTPLFQWCAIPARGVRRLPKEWIYQIDDPMAYAPDFFVRHLDLLDQLQQQPVLFDESGGMNITGAHFLLDRLQRLVEKPSDSPMPVYNRLQTEKDELIWFFTSLVSIGALHLDSDKEDPIASPLRPDFPGWFEGVPGDHRRRALEFSDGGIRQSLQLSWRRSYLMFAIRSLACQTRFAKYLLPEGWQGSWGRNWWDDWVRPKLGPEQLANLDWNLRGSLKTLTQVED